jgi:hypothetical protein
MSLEQIFYVSQSLAAIAVVASIVYLAQLGWADLLRTQETA